MIITIDGPSGTGKSSVSTRLANRLGFSCFDTGAMYRAFTVEILDQKVSLEDHQALQSLLDHFRFRIEEDDKKRYYIGEREVTDAIRSVRVTEHVSQVSALREVRKKLIYFQKQFARKKDAVFEGRDMGTVVFPNADLKIFLTASPEARAKRRFLEWQQKKIEGHPSFEEVLEQIKKRDHLDSSREISPLKKAKDAHEIDTTELTLDEVVDNIEALWRERC